MPFPDAVGKHPEGPGSEEAYRRPVSHPASAAGRRARGRASISGSTLRPRSLLAARSRLHVAALVALGLIALLAVVLPARAVHISVDGMAITTHTRNVDEAAVVQGAGVALRAGDRVQRQDNETLAVHRALDATLLVDGKTYAARAQSDAIARLLDQAGVTLGADDSVVVNGVAVSPSASATSAGQALTIEVRRAVPFAVVQNGQQLQLRSSAQTIAAALRDVGIRLGAGDEVQPPLDTQLTAGLRVRVARASELLVTLPEGRRTVYTVASTVGVALAQSGVPLPADYRLEPPAETVVSAGLAVHVVGISSELFLETERIQSYVVYQPDPHLPSGTQRIVEGQDGVHYRQFEVVSQDGTPVSRELAAEWDDPAPVDTVIYYSTAPAPVVAQAPPVVSSGEWRDLVCAYSWDCSWALAVIACESGGNPDAYNPQGYVGLFQIWEGFGANLRDPATNIAAAYSLFVSGGAGNWPNCP